MATENGVRWPQVKECQWSLEEGEERNGFSPRNFHLYFGQIKLILDYWHPEL